MAFFTIFIYMMNISPFHLCVINYFAEEITCILLFLYFNFCI